MLPNCRDTTDIIWKLWFIEPKKFHIIDPSMYSSGFKSFWQKVCDFYSKMSQPCFFFQRPTKNSRIKSQNNVWNQSFWTLSNIVHYTQLHNLIQNRRLTHICTWIRIRFAWYNLYINIWKIYRWVIIIINQI